MPVDGVLGGGVGVLRRRMGGVVGARVVERWQAESVSGQRWIGSVNIR